MDHDSSGVIQQVLISLDDNNLILLLKWYNNGLKQEETVEDQNGAGYRKTWYGTGKPEGYMEFKDGTIDGRRILWNETGKIIQFEIWSNGELVEQIIGE